MKRRIKRIIIDLVGVLFILIGIAGLVLPFLQGILFIIIGMYFLSLHSEWFRRKVQKLKTRLPRLGGFIDGMDVKVRKFLNLPL